MRNAFADELTKLAVADSRIVLLSGDIGNKLFDEFKEKCPGRFYNCGVAEQNMMGVAAGLAMSGLRPVVYTITPFVTTRCLEQIRNDVCYHNVPVVIAATGAGLSYADLGPTHHSCEDIAFMRVLPNMTVTAPGDAFEVRGVLRAALKHDGPVYLRLGKVGEKTVHTKVPEIVLGKSLVICRGDDVCLLSTGNMLSEAVEAASLLGNCAVVSFSTVKPLDEKILESVFGDCDYALVATIEEHSLIGGFGQAVMNVASGMYPIDGDSELLHFGIPDEFIKYSGSQKYFREQLGLTGKQIAEKIRRVVGNEDASRDPGEAQLSLNFG